MKYLILVFLLTFCLKGNSQNLITVTQIPKVVPEGKKWILKTNQKILIEVNNSSLIAGNRCHSYLFSSPHIVTAILEGNYGNPVAGYGLLSKTLEKEPYTNDYTYSITPLSIVDNNFNLSSLKDYSIETVGERQVAFMSGQKVYVSGCLTSVQFFESNMTQNELQIANQKKSELELKAKSLEYKPVGNRLVTITKSSLNGKDDWENRGITGLTKVIIRDKKDEFILINAKGVITNYGIGNKKNLENGQQEFEIGRFDRATLTFKDDQVIMSLRTVHHKDMGYTDVYIDGTIELISDEDVDIILKQIQQSVKKGLNTDLRN